VSITSIYLKAFFYSVPASGLYSQILPPEDEGSSYVAFPVYEDSIFPPEESYNKAHSDYSEAYSELFLEGMPLYVVKTLAFCIATPNR